jgi:allantoinase
MEREYVPFHARRGLPVWPDGKTLAVAIYLAVEEWNEDPGADYTFLNPMWPPLLPHMTRPDLAIRSSIQYGHRVGVWRIAEILDRHSVKVSIVANGLTAERHPAILRALVAKGYDLVAHGYDQSRLFTQLSREEQANDIDRCVKVFEDATGVRLRGFCPPGGRQYQITLDLMAERDFAFHMGLHDDELPYLLHFGKRTMVEVPYRLTNSGEINDCWMYDPPRVADEAMRYCRAIIDARYRDSAIRPQLLVIGTHSDVMGRPDRAETLSEVIGYLKTLPNVWLTTMGGLADRWREIVPSLRVEFVRETC